MIERSSKGLANCMFEELDNLRRGEVTAQQARASAALANTICTISRLEMDYARFVSNARSEESNALNALPMGALSIAKNEVYESLDDSMPKKKLKSRR